MELGIVVKGGFYETPCVGRGLSGGCIGASKRKGHGAPSVCHAVATLRDGGFLTMDEDYFLHLTDAGLEVAEQIYEKHRFFTDRLIEAGVDPETAERDACRIEHVISKETFERLKAARKLSEKAVISSDES